MTVKVHELAKELGVNSTDLVKKLNSMGIDAKSHMSVISDMEAMAVKNTISKSKAGNETKIVKVVPKKTETNSEEP